MSYAPSIPCAPISRCTDEAHRIDARSWTKLLAAGASFTCTWTQDAAPIALLYVQVHVSGANAALLYARTGDSLFHLARQYVELVYMPAHFGGTVARFMCPTCSRRVAVLYSGVGGFACRCCQGLAYRSTREPKHDRLVKRAERLRDQLGWKGGIFAPEGRRPPRMAKRTFARLVADHRALKLEALQEALART